MYAWQRSHVWHNKTLALDWCASDHTLTEMTLAKLLDYELFLNESLRKGLLTLIIRKSVDCLLIFIFLVRPFALLVTKLLVMEICGSGH